MKRFLNKFKKVIRKVVNIQIKVLLFMFYFVFITPFGIFVRLFKDYLGIESNPSWENHSKISDVSKFLKRQ